MAVVNTNISASLAQASLARNERALSKAMEQLSTGKKINTAADDAAGLARPMVEGLVIRVRTYLHQRVEALHIRGLQRGAIDHGFAGRDALEDAAAHAVDLGARLRRRKPSPLAYQHEHLAQVLFLRRETHRAGDATRFPDVQVQLARVLRPADVKQTLLMIRVVPVRHEQVPPNQVRELVKRRRVRRRERHAHRASGQRRE